MTGVLTEFINLARTVQFKDYIDILIIAYIIYQGIRLVRNTRAEQLVKGIVILIILLQLSMWFELNMVKYILQNTMQVGIIAVFVLFQPELRRALEQVGRSKFSKIFGPGPYNDVETIERTVNVIGDAVSSLAKNRIGALIVVERETKISDIIRTGINMDSLLSAELLVNIFVPNTPLHDGAVIVRDGKISAAACFLPLTANADLSSELGTRHRAALGMSETSDALVVVVSEETGKISLALDGALTRNLTVESLKKAMMKILTPREGTPSKKILFKRGKNNV